MEDARSKYLRKMHTPTPFSQGPEMKNYSRMMELQSQAPNFTKNDPRFSELKDRRRTYNRNDKYKIGDKFNVAPLDVQKDFSNRSNDFRNVAPNVYRKMYPLQDMAMRYGESGGLWGLMAKEMFGKVSDFGKDMANKVGITGAADTDEAEMQDYAAKTFGMDGVPNPQQDFGHDLPPLPEISIEFNGDPEPVKPRNLTGENPIGEVSSMRSFGDRGTVPYGYEMNALDAIAEDDYKQGNKITAYPPPIKEEDDIKGMAPPEVINEPLPFDEGREAYIRKQNEYNPIRRSTFVAPFDDYDPDQFRFDNYDEYYKYLRKKRGIGEFIDDYYKGFTYDPRVDGIPLDYIPSAPDLEDR
jgi:hypothetical protein